MATNNAHNAQTRDIILHQVKGHPRDAINFLIISIDKFFNNEIRETLKGDNPQTSLMFMGTHAVSLSLSEIIFKQAGSAGFKKFLATFIDGNSKDLKFSSIGMQLHEWRNVLAHGWISERGHKIDYDFNSSLGYHWEVETLIINPALYLEQYLAVFGPGGKIWDYLSTLSMEELISSQEVIIRKYFR